MSAKEAAVCIVCNENMSVLKEYSTMRNYETKYGSKLIGMQCRLQMEK
jgi:nitrate/TMAO reductase-like tetraheme cytochrome c subunit